MMEETIVFRFSTAILAIPILIAIGTLITAGVLFALRKIGLGVIATIVGLVAGLLFAPAMYADRVIVTGTGITQKTGFWFSPTHKGFQYADVAHVRITDKPMGPKQRMTEVWEVHHRTGLVEDIRPGDLWSTNADEIVALLKVRGVAFIPR